PAPKRPEQHYHQKFSTDNEQNGNYEIRRSLPPERNRHRWIARNSGQILSNSQSRHIGARLAQHQFRHITTRRISSRDYM
ncbi:hypothetical protein, partial [Limoniibacter endophyticus]|uniref:hypothetical protein n=1 Tax=Limoniibacter endophyticus TaxID=1565040 RepID=UPI001AEDD466